MIVQNIISSHIEPIGMESTVTEALLRMELVGFRSYPVVDASTSKYIGEVHKEQLSEVLNRKDKAFLYKTGEETFIVYNEHLFDAAKSIFRSGREMYPVVDDNMVYLGILLRDRLTDAIGTMLNLKESGAVIAVEMEEKDFTLSNLIRLIEQENAKILGIAIEQPVSFHMRVVVSVKINLTDLTRVSASLRRHDFTIISESSNVEAESEMADRADEFFKYLNI